MPGTSLNPLHQSPAGRNIGPRDTPSNIDLTWHKDDFVFRADADLRPNVLGDIDYRGTVIILDCSSGAQVWREDWGDLVATPTGIVFADGLLYVADSESAAIFIIDPSLPSCPVVARITNRAFNDIHGIQRTSRGLLVACTGSDAIIEIDLQGNSLWEWWAVEHGFETSPSEHIRISGRGREHRDVHYHTRYQTTHVNSVNFSSSDERFVLASLFHQGCLVRIDRWSQEQSAEVILDALARPHSIRQIPGGWTLANSWAREFIVLDEEFRVVKRVGYKGGWLQDCLRISDGRFVLNDVDEHKLVFLNEATFETEQEIAYDANWRIYELQEVPTSLGAADFRVLRPCPLES